MPVPKPYRKFCSGGSPVLKPANSPARFSAMATTAAIEAHTTYKTEQAISRLRVERVIVLIIFLLYYSTPVSLERRFLVATPTAIGAPRVRSTKNASPVRSTLQPSPTT